MLTSAQPIEELEPEFEQDRLAEELDPEAQQERLLLEQLPKIKYIAQRVLARLPANVELDDLISEGIFGLIDASRRFDPSRGVKFSTYAEMRIRGAMLDSLRNLDWVPRSVRKKSKGLERAEKELEQRLGRAPAEKELADEMGISLRKYHNLREKIRCSSALQSLQETKERAPKKHESPLKEVCEWLHPGPFSYLQQQELRTILAEAIEQLPKRERLVVSLYYFDELTMKEVGAVLGVNESRASQYHSRAKARLLTHLRKLKLRRDTL